MNKTSVVEHALLAFVRTRLSISGAAFGHFLTRHPAIARNLVWASVALLATQAVAAVGVVETIFPAVLPNCSVGYLGTAANVSFSGFGADRECQNLQTIDPAFIRATVSGPVLCRVQLGAVLATVRDRGAFPYTGSAICAYLERRTATLGSGS